ncbi:MAG: ATP-binding protein [Phycisphaerales bacterium]
MLSLRIHLVLYVLAMSALVAAGAIWYGLHGQDRTVTEELERATRAAGLVLAQSISTPIARADRTAVEQTVREWMARGVFARITVEDARGDRVAHAIIATPRPPRYWWLWKWVLGDGTEDPPLVVATPIVGPTGGRLGVIRVQLPSERDALTMHAAVTRGVGMAALALGFVTVFTALAAGYLTTPLGRIAHGVAELGKENFGVRIELGGPLELAGLAFSINNVAERLKSMAALQASTIEKSNFINNVVESMVASLMVVDQDAKVRALNPATGHLLGYKTDELIGRSSSLICVADGFHLTSSRLSQLLGSGALKDHEVNYISKDNRHIPVSLSGSAIKDAKGRVTGYVCIGTDISQRKQAEAEKQKLHSQLVATSRQAGMAEVATGVLHNVGNVLNSINVSAAVVEETLKKSKVPMVRQVADLLGENRADIGRFMAESERGRLLPDYLSKLAQHLADEQASLMTEMKSLSNHVGHVKDIIGVQQSISRPAGVVELLSVRDLLEDAVQMVAPSAARHHVTIVREFSETPQVKTDKHRVLQVLVNLLTNAMDAVKETAPQRDGRIVLRVKRNRPDTKTVRVEVEDNGIGIPPDNVTRIFTHGFTTKKKGHGFGLHSCALAAKELQGALTVSSPGPGQGSTFTLVLPIEPAMAGAAAGATPPAAQAA